MIRAAEKLSGTALPKWSAVVPHSNFKPLPRASRQAAVVVYVPTCISRVMGTSPRKNEASIIEVFVEISRRAGIPVWIPEDSPGNCCGMPFSSKGFTQAFRETLHRTIQRFWDWSEEGRKPVVIDSSSCAYTLLTSRDALTDEDRAFYDRMKLLDPIEYAHTMLLPRLSLRRLNGPVVLHPNCSAVKLGLQDKLVAIASACAADVTVPANLKCCGFAGDRGLLFPELTASATLPEAQEVMQREYAGYYSSNLTCEMGMSQATGRPYQSILYLIEAASKP
jgi:D-lactate dehydrogenase